MGKSTTKYETDDVRMSGQYFPQMTREASHVTGNLSHILKVPL